MKKFIFAIFSVAILADFPPIPPSAGKILLKKQSAKKARERIFGISFKRKKSLARTLPIRSLKTWENILWVR